MINIKENPKFLQILFSKYKHSVEQILISKDSEIDIIIEISTSGAKGNRNIVSNSNLSISVKSSENANSWFSDDENKIKTRDMTNNNYDSMSDSEYDEMYSDDFDYDSQHYSQGKVAQVHIFLHL